MAKSKLPTIIFRPTGEFRPPKTGEWYLDNYGVLFLQAARDYYETEPRAIYTRHEVDEREETKKLIEEFVKSFNTPSEEEKWYAEQLVLFLRFKFPAPVTHRPCCWVCGKKMTKDCVNASRQLVLECVSCNIYARQKPDESLAEFYARIGKKGGAE